jgi:tetratricopeptide (TPR) repeat protein
MALLAGALSTLHETQLAERVLAIPHPPAGRSAAYYARVQSYWLRAVSRQAEVEEDWPRALAAADQWDALAAQWPGLRYWDRTVQMRALALAHTGHMAEAQRLIGTSPADCYACLVIRGQIAQLAGQRAVADRWFAEALRQGPTLPFAEGNWARALLTRGDVAGAVGKAKAALAKNPNYVEAAMTLAEAKLAQGDAAGAASGLAELSKASPGWARLHLKWGEALARQGKGAAAHAQFTAAARLDLTPTERAELAAQKV